MSVYIRAVSFTSLKDNIVPQELSRGLRRADDYIRLAVAGAHRVLAENQGEETFDKNRCGLVLGSCFSTMQTNFEVLDDVVSGEQTSPTLFSHSVFNSAAGYIASTMKITGAALALIDFSFPFFKALQEGYLALASDRLESCIVLQVETYSDLMADGRSKLVPEGVLWEPGVVCWLLTKEQDTGGCSFLLENIELETHLAEPKELLARKEVVTLGTSVHSFSDPLGSAAFLTGMIEQKESGGAIELQSDCGWARLSIKRIS